MFVDAFVSLLVGTVRFEIDALINHKTAIRGNDPVQNKTTPQLKSTSFATAARRRRH